MPKFTICGSIACPDKQKCYRYRAVPNDNQKYHSFYGLKNKEHQCWYFVEILPNDKLMDY